MPRFDKAIVIGARLRDVFDYVSRPEHFPEFLPITSLTFLTNMHRGTGTRVRYIRTIDGREVPTECALTKLSIDDTVEYSGTQGVLGAWRFIVKEAEDGTQLRWEGEYDVPSSLREKFMGQRARALQVIAASLDESIQKIKQALEPA